MDQNSRKIWSVYENGASFKTESINFVGRILDNRSEPEEYFYDLPGPQLELPAVPVHISSEQNGH